MRYNSTPAVGEVSYKFSSVRPSVCPSATQDLRNGSLIFWMKLDNHKVRKVTMLDFGGGEVPWEGP